LELQNKELYQGTTLRIYIFGETSPVMKKLLFVLLLSPIACAPSTEKSDAQKIIDQSITAYGGEAWDTIALAFKFRNHRYHLKRNQDQFIYVRTALEGEAPYTDSLWSDGRFLRYRNAAVVQLSDSLKKVYTASVNSVLYFIQIPYVLNDEAVLKEQLSDQTIKGKKYHTLKITFQQEGGGEDYQDEFRYWINKETSTVDYMAYTYFTDGGGTRFRSAFNQRNIGAIKVQDYLNLKPTEKFVPLDSLPKMYAANELQQLSIIENTEWELHPQIN
jgi:hypothetical protein